MHFGPVITPETDAVRGYEFSSEKKKTVLVVVLAFYGPSTLLRSFWARSVNLSTLFLGQPARQFINP